MLSDPMSAWGCRRECYSRLKYIAKIQTMLRIRNKGATRLGYALALTLTCLLAACGGGSGGDSNAVNPVSPAFALQPAFPALRFAQITDLQAQAYPPGTAPSGDRLFVVQRNGLIKVFDKRADVSTVSVFLDISGRVTAGGEQGLLGLAFHPQFASNGHFYVFYTVETNSIPQRIRVSRFTVSDQSAAPNVADPSSEQIVLTVDQAAEGPPAANHNGGSLAFSPVDGLLYISVGDGGGGNDPNGNGQNVGTLSGSILRIDVDNPDGARNYGIPADNPFVGQAGARGEIFAYGLRNPFKFSFDTNGDLWIGDVGQNAREEVNYLAVDYPDYRNGPNYGWDCREGSLAGGGADAACNGVPVSAFIAPVNEYGLNGSQSITGGYVYRGTALPSLQGRYLFADFIAGLLWAYDSGTDARELLLDSDLNISSFGRDGAGELYVADFGGELFRIVADK